MKQEQTNLDSIHYELKIPVENREEKQGTSWQSDDDGDEKNV